MIRTIRVFSDSLKIFFGNHCLDRAAAISYYAFLSLLPIMLLLTAALGFVFKTRTDILENVIEFTRISVPYLSDRIVKDLEGLVAASVAFGWLSLVILLFSAEFVLNALSEALLHIFDVRESFGFFRRRVLNVLVALMAVLAALFSVLITAAVGIIRRVDISLYGIDLTYWLLESLTLKYIVPFLIIVFTVTVVFQIFSGPNLRIRYAFYGSLIFAVLWEAAKQGFTFYIYNFPAYNRFYGSLGTVMVLLVWGYFSAMIFLFSASVARAAFIDRNL